MNVERLLRLAEHIERVPAVEFDMQTWGTRDYCGAVCCAFGHACSIPEFATAGLVMDWEEDGYGVPVYEGFSEYRAAARFFGISEYEAQTLFAPGSYSERPDDIRPAEVAARIRGLVAKQAK